MWNIGSKKQKNRSYSNQGPYLLFKILLQNSDTDKPKELFFSLIRGNTFL